LVCNFGKLSSKFIVSLLGSMTNWLNNPPIKIFVAREKLPERLSTKFEIISSILLRSATITAAINADWRLNGCVGCKCAFGGLEVITHLCNLAVIPPIQGRF